MVLYEHHSMPKYIAYDFMCGFMVQFSKVRCAVTK